MMANKKMTYLIIIFLISFLMTSLLYPTNIFAGAYYKGEPNEYFDGVRFKRIGIKNIHPDYSPSLLSIFLDLTNIKKIASFTWEPWEKEEIQVNQSVPESRIFGDSIRYYFINHSTILIQTNGINIITDPIYSKQAGFLFGPVRVHKPGISFENLPKIDLILLSHSHYDHFDNKTLLDLYKRDNPTIITPVGNDYLLKKLNKNIKVIPLLWDEQIKFESLQITLTKAYHWSKRGINDTNKTLWGGFIIQSPTKTIYFAGDTAFGDEDGKIFKEIGNKFKHIDIAFLPIGAYLPYDFMKDGHTSPEDSVKIHQLLKAKQSVAIHFGTFQLSAEKRLEPLIDLEKAKEKYNLQVNDFISLDIGEFKDLK